MIGRFLVEFLLERGAQVRIASLDDSSLAHPQAEFRKANLVHFDECLEVCKGIDYVFHLAAIKGSPAVTAKAPANFFVLNLLLNTNMMEAARQQGAKRFLYTSTVGVYAPAEILREDDVWKTFPSENDKFAGWAKRIGELQAEAYAIQYGWDQIAVVRPANAYGPYDTFEGENAMVIPSLIKRALDGGNPLRVWGDGSPRRDFIHAKDVARGMLLAHEHMIGKPINLGSGKGVSIREVVEVIVNNLDVKPEVVWDTSQPSGDQIRVMDISRARSIGFEPEISLEQGIKEVMEWYKKNKARGNQRYNVFA
jgi:GDP-L-fucose synthase